MADIKLDVLGLQYSENFSISGLEEENIDLNLNPAAETFSTIYGIVTDGQNPIPNATVKVFDSNGMPYKHTLTDENGNYTISELPVGTYSGTVSGIIRVMLKYNGGGHKQVGTCQFSDENMETELPKMLKELCDLANN